MDIRSRSPLAGGGIAWPIALAVTPLLGTLASACMMPFVAIAVASALSMARWRAIVTIITAWAINQLLGFSWLGFPMTAYAIGWGVAMCVASLCSMLVVERIGGRRSNPALSLVITFATAFVIYEAALFAFAITVGGTETFTLPIIARIFANEGMWFMCLMALHVALTRMAPQIFGSGLSLKVA